MSRSSSSEETAHELTSTSTRKVASSARWAMLDQVFQQVVRFALTLLLTRLTSPESFGLIALAFVFTGIAAFVGDLGMGSAVVQRKVLQPRHIDTAIATATGLGLLLAGVVIALSDVIGAAFAEPALGPVLMVVSANFPLRAVAGVMRDILRRNMMFGPITIANGIAVVGSGLAGAITALMGWGVWALVVYSVGESLLLVLSTGVMLAVKGQRVPRLRFDRQSFRDMFSFGMSVTLFKILYYLQINLDNLLVGRFLGATALGYYNLAYRLMLYPIQKVGDAVTQVALPAFSSVQDANERLTNAFRRGTTAISIAVFPLSVGTVVAADVVIPALFGNQWMPAVVPLQILALNGPRLALLRLGSAVFQAVGKPHWDVWLNSGGLVVYLIAFVIGLQHGVIGMAIAYTIAGYLVMAPNLILINNTPMIRPMRALLTQWPIAVACLGLILGAEAAKWLVPGTSLLAAMVVIAGGALGYGLVLALVGRRLVGEVIADFRGRKSGGSPDSGSGSDPGSSTTSGTTAAPARTIFRRKRGGRHTAREVARRQAGSRSE